MTEKATNTSLIPVLPTYEPKIDERSMTRIDLNIRDLQAKYPNGCICCGTTFIPKKFSNMISGHFNTVKHKKKCIIPSNQEFKQEFGISNNLNDAFDNKCKEVRDLKKLNYEYKQEIEKLQMKIDRFEGLNIKLQELLQIKNKTTHNSNPNPICENLIDLL